MGRSIRAGTCIGYFNSTEDKGLKPLPQRLALFIFFCCVGVLTMSTRTYATQVDEKNWTTMIASLYGAKHHGRIMARGGLFNMYDPTIVAHWTLPMGTKLLLKNPSNGREQEVCVRDRGPDPETGRKIDVSQAAAENLGYVNKGVTTLLTRVIGMCEKYVWAMQSPQNIEPPPPTTRKVVRMPRQHFHDSKE